MPRITYAHITYKNDYEWLYQRVNITRGLITSIVPSFAHEYTHHVQTRVGWIPVKTMLALNDTLTIRRNKTFTRIQLRLSISWRTRAWKYILLIPRNATR